jgi:hypothetical protein
MLERAPRQRRGGILARLPLVCAIVLAPTLLLVVPAAIQSGRLLAHAEDPVALADHETARLATSERLEAEIREALDNDDVELAQSFVGLAEEQHRVIDPGLRDRVDAAAKAQATLGHTASHFVRGLVSGEPSDLVELAGTATGDLFVFGDIRDALREGSRMARGEQADELILGLACAGLAITAGTYVSGGAATPARFGLSFIKAARKTGRLGKPLAEWAAKATGRIIEPAALRGALTPAALLQPAVAVRAARDAVKLEKLERLVTLAGDVAVVQRKAGTRAALDGMKLAESPRDMSRLARLAASKGAKTRAILKLAGRAAIALTVGAWQLASWLLWAIGAAFGFCACIKRTAERATESFLRRRKRRAAAAVLYVHSSPMREAHGLDRIASLADAGLGR